VAREIGVGYDGSPESEHALGVARRLADELGVTLLAFEAVYFPARAYVGPAYPDAQAIALNRLAPLPADDAPLSP